MPKEEAGEIPARMKIHISLKFATIFMLLLGLVGAIAGSYLYRVDQERRRIRFNLVVTQIQAEAHKAHAAARHDISNTKQALNQRIAELNEQFELEGFSDQAWAQALLGRAFQAVGHESRAYALLVSAWDKGFRDAELASSFARLVFWDPISGRATEERSARLREILSRTRSERHQPDTDLREALVLLAAGRFEAVLEAARSVPNREQRWLLLGLEATAYCRLGDARRAAGRIESALVEYRLAVLVTEKMARLQPSNPISHLISAQLYCRMYQAEVLEKSDALPTYLDAGLNAVRMAMAVEPDNADAADLYRKLQTMRSHHAI